MKTLDMHNDENIAKIFEPLKESDQAMRASAEWGVMRSMLVSEGILKARKRKRWFLVFGITLITLLSIAVVSNFNWFSEPNKQMTNGTKEKVKKEYSVLNNEHLKNSIDKKEESLNKLEVRSDTDRVEITKVAKYHVQIGAHLKQVERDKYSDVPDLIIERSNKDGYSRYYAGEFQTREEAEKRLLEVKTEGREDAFILPIEKPNSFNNQIVSNTAIKNENDKREEVISISKEGQLLEIEESIGSKESPINDNLPTSPLVFESTEEGQEEKKVYQVQTVDKSFQEKRDEGSEEAILKDTSMLNKEQSVQITEQDSLSEEIIEELTEVEKDTATSCSKWSVGIHFSKDYNSHSIEENRPVEWIADFKNSYDQYLSNREQFSVGASIHYRFNCKLSLISGLTYSKKGRLEARLPDDNVEGEDSVIFRFTGNYIDIPLTAQFYYLNQNRIKMYVGGGVLFNINSPIGSESIFQERGENDHISKITLQPHSFNMSAIIKLGIEYQLSKRLHGYIEPRYQHGLTPIVRHPTYKMPLDQFIRSYAFGLGVIYDLK